MKQAPFRVTRRVEFHDTDMGGIMHFSAYFRHMEAAEHAFLRSLGLGVAMQHEGQAIGFPRVSASCDFRRPLLFEDEFEVQVSVQEIGKKSVAYRFQISRDGQEMATGQMTSVCCLMQPPHPPSGMPIPESIAAKLREHRHEEPA